MELSIFVQIGLVISIAAVVAVIMRLLRQPLIMGYIITGVVVGPSMLGVIRGESAHSAFETFAEIGIALLLFIIGLGLNASVIRSLGKVSLTAASVLLLTVGTVGFLATLLFGFDVTTSIFVGIALFFSSTIIILKTLSDKHEVGRLYGQVAIGVVLVDDIVATLALVAVTMLSHGSLDAATFGFLALKAAGLGALLYIVGAHVIPRIAKFLASSSELLFLFSIAWGLSIASLFSLAGFSYELGALFAGVSLAGLPYAVSMAAKLKPLRDFFIVLFFVSIGELFTFEAASTALIPALILSLIVMVGKPLFVMASLGFLGYTKFTSFKTAIHLSQVSEFSIILITFAATSGVVADGVVPIITMVALITIGISTYMMKYDDKLYRAIDKKLGLFERKKTNQQSKNKTIYPAILLGFHKGGHEFLTAFREMKLNYLVIDHDPAVIEHLEAQGIRHEFGDATDEEFLREIGAANAELVVSTIESCDANLTTLQFLRAGNSKVSFVCHALNYDDAARLYEAGASYVSLPHYIGSERVSNFIKRHGMSHSALRRYRDRHLITIGRKAVSSD